MGTGVSFAGGKSAVHPVTRSRVRGAIPLLPPYTGTTLYRFLKSLCTVILNKVWWDNDSILQSWLWHYTELCYSNCTCSVDARVCDILQFRGQYLKIGLQTNSKHSEGLARILRMLQFLVPACEVKCCGRIDHKFIGLWISNEQSLLKTS